MADRQPIDVRTASKTRLRGERDDGTPGSTSIQGRAHDSSGSLAVHERMEKSNLGGGSIDQSVPKPNRDAYPKGLAGEAAYQNAYRAYQRKALKSPVTEKAQKNALSKM